MTSEADPPAARGTGTGADDGTPVRSAALFGGSAVGVALAALALRRIPLCGGLTARSSRRYSRTRDTE